MLYYEDPEVGSSPVVEHLLMKQVNKLSKQCRCESKRVK